MANPTPQTSVAMRPLYTSCAEHYRSDSAESESPWLSLTAERPKPNAIPGDSPFLKLPTEIRLQVYSLLVLPRTETDLLPSYERVSVSSQDYFDYEKKQHGTDRPATANLSRPTLLFRTIDPLHYKQRVNGSLKEHVRSTYSVRSDRFRARLMSTTYHCVNPPRIGQNLGIMGANKQIHTEVAEMLYSHYAFDFDTHIEVIEPFLQDLTPFSRSCIKSTRIVKRALAYEKEYDRCEWSNAVQCLSSPEMGVNLRSLALGVVAGKPGPNGWDRIAAYSANDFNLLVELEGMSWIRDLLEIKGLQETSVEAVVEHCPPATNSMAMASYIRFSASVQEGLAGFMKQQLLGS